MLRACYMTREAGNTSRCVLSPGYCHSPTPPSHPTRCRLDRDQDGALSRPELQAMLVSLELAGNPYDDEQLGSQVGFWLREMEGEGSEAISRAAFLAGGASTAACVDL